MPWHCVATFAFRFQPEAGPNSYRGSKPSRLSPSALAARNFPGALETLTFPVTAFQNDRLTLREAGPVGCRLGTRAASGQDLLLPILLFRECRTGPGAHPKQRGR